jgi:predicted TIM-barrel fold metal-dependent hydrolase
MATASPPVVATRPSIVDSHAHVWALDAYPWQPSFGIVPEQPALPEMLLREMDRGGVSHAILVQPSAYGPDHRFLLDTVRAHPDRFLPVGLVDPADPVDVAALVEAGCVGLRVNLALDLDRAAAQAHAPAWAALEAAAVPICLRGGPAHLALVEAILDRHPGTTFVVDHLALPEPGRPLAAICAIRRLSAFAHCRLKVAGLDRLTSGNGPHRELWPVVQAAIGMFGPSRLIWGSDFPNANYRSSVRAIEGMPFITPAERHQIMAGTACELWGVPRVERTGA